MAQRGQGAGACRGHAAIAPHPSHHLPTTMLQAPLRPDDTPSSARTGSFARLPQADSLAAFGLRVSRHFAQCRREGEQLALLWLKIEMPPPGGDDTPEREHLLQTVSLRLRNRVRGTDEVVYMGERCFAVLLMAAGAAEAALVEQRLRLALRGSYGLDGRLLQVGVRLGLALYPQAGRNGAELAEAARGCLPALPPG